MKLSLKCSGFLVLGGALLVTLLIGLLASLMTKQPESPPLFSVKVGVLEDRKPSPNSRVWAIPESAESQLSMTVELRMAEINREQETYAHLIEMRAFYKKIYKPDTTDLSDSSRQVLNDYSDRKLSAALAEIDLKLRNLPVDTATSHKRFIDKLAEMLDLIECTHANTSMDGTVVLSQLKEPKVVIYVLPALPEQFTYSRKALDLAADHEAIVELQKLRSTFENP
jgi:hypothetical protein